MKRCFDRDQRLLALVAAVLIAVGVSVWLPQQPSLGPGAPGIGYPALLETGPGHIHAATPVMSPDSTDMPNAAPSKAADERPVDEEYLTGLHHMGLSGAMVAAILAALITVFGRARRQLVGMYLPAVFQHPRLGYVPARLQVFLL